MRESIWLYPNKLSQSYGKFRPVSTILLAFLCSFIVVLAFDRVDLLALTRQQDDLYWDEGAVGTVTSMNPLFISQNQIDRDLAELIYDRLIYINPAGEPQAALAESWDVSEDGTQYEFTIGEGHRWHDGERVDAEDVVYTLRAAREVTDTTGANTVATALDEVEIELVDTYTVRLSVPERTTSLFETLSIHIVPEHILSRFDVEDLADYGLEILPTGSGPYRVVSIRDEFVELVATESNQDADIQRIRYNFYDTYKEIEIAFRNNSLDSIANIPQEELSFVSEYGNYTLYKSLVDQRKKIIYFNNNQAPLDNEKVRIALSHLTDKSEVLLEAGVDAKATDSPISSSSWAFNSDVKKYEPDTAQAAKYLEEAGYTLKDGDDFYTDEEGNILTLEFYYLNNHLNNSIAEALRDMWNEQGVNLSLRAVSLESIINEVLATRTYQMVMLEIETTIDPDQYNLWHSLRTDYPDLNISGYSYERVDFLLERARVSRDRDDRKEDYLLIQRYIVEDAPALFLYEPYFNYVVPSRVSGVEINEINYPSERFRNITQWKLE